MQQVEDPPFLSVGTEVSAKYKGAFCEAKVKKVVRNIKCKIAYKQGLGSGTVSDELIKGVLRVGATVEVKHPDKREYIEATITKIQDCSQYTVVFDDGDIMTLRRTALCLKSGRHFNESETLDQLPLTHPEHFGNPVIGGRRGRRSRHLQDDSSDEDDDNDSKEVINEKEEHIGKVVCVESTETKKKDKEKWFPGLVVSPTAQVTVRIRVKDEYLVRSFKDGRYYTVPKKEAMEFTRELAAKQDGSAVQAALLYLDNSTLPPHWDKDALFGLANSSSEYEGELDSDSSDDEPREEKDHFVAQLYKYMDDRGTPLNKVPSITNKDVDLYRLFRAVQKLGGYNRVTSQNQWKSITMRLGFIPPTVSVTNLVKQAYKKFLQPFEEFDRKLGCSMSMTPRNANRSKGRSLVRANSVASPKPEVKEQKIVSAAEESENTSESSMDAIKSKRKLSTGSGKVKALVDKFEEKCKEEPPEAVCKPIKTTTKEEVIAPSPSGSTSSAPGSSKERKEKTAKRTTPVAQDEKRSGRKRKEGNTEKLGDAPPANEFPVDIGDKLKVYYHEKKVTYEAKVIETSLQHGTPFYLVHYTGWNTRYDEWVPRERIAENLTTSKAKRSKGSSGNQKSMTNIPPNDGTKSATGIGDKGNTFNVTTLTTNLAVGKNLMASKRGRGRSDSQPPRSTTPSSMASNSSRTKSPAATARRRTTRAQPSGSRRTSNNVSDISMQTESDSDSDEPVKKPIKSSVLHTPMLTASFEPSTSGVCKIGLIKSLAASVTNSQSETEEEEICGSAKGRDYDLNQIRSELKGFKELKSPSPESESAAQVSSERKTTNIFDFEPVDDTEANPLISIIAKSATESKSSSTELSSESDSFADDDSQSSDKTTMLQNMTEKFQQKIKAEKLAQAKCLERLNAGDSVEKIMPLKSSGIEKIIEDSLAEKQQESMKSKPFIIEKRKEVTEKEEIPKVPSTETTSPIKAVSIDRKPLKIPTSQDKKLIDVPDIQPIVPKVEKKPTTTPNSDTTPITAKPATADENTVEVIKTEKPSKESGVLCSTADIYEFKEPEPFEFETRKPATTALSSPEIDKKPQKKNIQKAPETPIPDIKPSTSVVAAKKIKKSPPTEQDKLKPIKIEEKPIIADVTTTSPTILLTPIKNENTFDALRKSPSFNLNITPNEENAQVLQETVKANSEVTDRPGTLVMPSTSSEVPQLNIPFISPFVETLKESPQSAETGNADKDSTSKSSCKKNELETVKRILALDPGFDLEPPKADKWKISIADKVLKALNQQKQEELKPKEEPPAQISFPPIIEAPQISSFAIAEPPKIELPAIIKKEIEIPLKKPILSSPEHKLDILESIAPKNNDLSETIQKLESVIQNRSVIDNFNDDSSDSTDSERRLVIEDDSQSSETNQTDIGYDADAVNKAIFHNDKPFSNITDVPFEIYTPKIQPSIFNLQTLPNSALAVPSTSGTSSTPPALHSDLFTPDVEPAIKVENPPIELQNIVAVTKLKKEEPPTNQDTSPIMHSEAITLLLCEETIPGSPTPSKESSDIKPNVHPTESDIKPIPMDIECSALPSLPEVSTSAKMKAEMNTPNSSPRDSMSQDESSEDLKKQHDQDSANSPKKRRRTRKHSESEQLNKRRRHNTNVPKRNNASDSDDNSDANLSQRSSNRSARPCQYNFLVQLDPAMNPNQRISILNKKISDLRKTYNMIKAELASIDRRRKKLRRREREKKTQQKINC